MSYIELFLTAFGLSMDAFAVSLSDGLAFPKLRRFRILAIALCFGAMQGLMPTIGYLLGSAFSGCITKADHLLALVLLGFIGVKMIADACPESSEKPHPKLTVPLLLTQGIATSIDALAVGIGFAALPDVRICDAAGCIAGVTFVCSLVGVHLGKKCGASLGRRAMIAGGLILIGIGVKIFIAHTFFA